MRKIKSGKIRWAIDILIIVVWAAVFCIAFVPGLLQDMLSKFGPDAYLVNPYLLFFAFILAAVRAFCVEGRKKSLVTIRSPKIRLALNILIIIVAAAILCIAFIPGILQSMVARYGRSAELVNPFMELFLVGLAAMRLFWVESGKNVEQ